jgi:non-specific serine/threonine protein kinase
LEERIDEMIRDKKKISSELFDGDGEVKLTEMSNEQLMSFVSLDLKKASAGE